MPDITSAAPMTDVARLRLVLMRELETISTYEDLAVTAQRPEVRDFFLHLAKEEKEHVAEATQLLRRMDADQDGYFQREYPASHFAPGAASEPIPEPSPTPTKSPVPALPAPTSQVAGRFTVGSLKRRESPSTSS